MANGTIPHSATRYSHHYLLYGRVIGLPLLCFRKVNNPGTTVDEQVEQLQWRLQDAYGKAAAQSSKQAAGGVQVSQEKRKPRYFQIGDHVYLHVPSPMKGAL